MTDALAGKEILVAGGTTGAAIASHDRAAEDIPLYERFVFPHPRGAKHRSRRANSCLQDRF
jgi:hypothetical protein